MKVHIRFAEIAVIESKGFNMNERFNERLTEDTGYICVSGHQTVKDNDLLRQHKGDGIRRVYLLQSDGECVGRSFRSHTVCTDKLTGTGEGEMVNLQRRLSGTIGHLTFAERIERIA